MVQADSPLSQVIGEMLSRDSRYAVVFDGKRYIGVIERDSLYKSKINPVSSKARSFVNHPPKVNKHTDLIHLAELMFHAYPCLLPVFDRDFIGVIRARDIIHQILNIKELADIRAEDVMTRDPICFSPKDRLGTAINIMKENKIGHAPIVENGKLIGILSFSDVIKKHIIYPLFKISGHSAHDGSAKDSSGLAKSAISERMWLMNVNVGDAASRISISANPNDKVAKIIKLMEKYKISDVVITKSGKPVGIITARDLLELFLRLKQPEFWGIYVVGTDRLKPFQLRGLKEELAEAYEKYRRAFFKNIIYFICYVKAYEVGEHGRTKWSVHLRLATPSHVFNNWESHFDLNTAISWALQSMERDLQDFKERLKQRAEHPGRGRRAIFEAWLRLQERLKGFPAYPKLVKRK